MPQNSRACGIGRTSDLESPSLTTFSRSSTDRQHSPAGRLPGRRLHEWRLHDGEARLSSAHIDRDLVADGDRGVKERQSDVLLQGWREGATRYLPHDDPGEDNVRDSMHLHVRARDAAIKAEQSAKLTTRVVDSD